MSTRTRLSFTVKLSAAGETLVVPISDPSSIEADNLALSTWGSSQVLADALHHLDVRPAADSNGGIPVLELGAGTGLVGLTAAVVWQTTSILTDLPPIIPNLEANIALSSKSLSARGGSCRCGVLDWINPDVLNLSDGESLMAKNNKAHIILAADTVYSEEHPQLLANAVKTWLSQAPTARLVLCYPLRVGYLDHIRDLWEQLESIGLCAVREGREQVDESWDEDVPYEWCIWKWKD